MSRRPAQPSGSATWPWPPEVPPLQPPGQPDQPPAQPPDRPPQQQQSRPPTPILPTWEQQASPWDDAMLDRLLEERIVLVSGRLDDALAERTAQQLLLLGHRDVGRPIELHLSCRGSDLAASLALAAAIDLAGAPVHTTLIGTLSGPALAPLCASQRRSAHRFATVVLTLPRAIDAGAALAPVGIHAEEHDRMIREVVERVATATGRPTEQVSEELHSGRVLTADEAQGYGLVGAVV